MNSRKNGIDPRHIVRDVTEDLFNEGLLGYAKWLSIPENREWAQGVAKRALGRATPSEYQPPTIQSKRKVTATFRRYKKYPNRGIFVIEGGSRPAVRGKTLDWDVQIEKTTDLRDAKVLAGKLLPYSRLYREAGGQAPMGAYQDVINAVAALIVDISVNGLPEAPNA